MKFIELKELTLEKMNEIIKIESEEYPGGGVDPWILKSLFHYGKIFTIEENDEIISICEFMSSFNKNEAYLYGICTKGKYQGKGSGTLLLEKSEEILKETGIKVINLTVDPNNLSAIALYTKLGYTKIKFMENEYGPGINRYLMTKKLDK